MAFNCVRLGNATTSDKVRVAVLLFSILIESLRRPVNVSIILYCISRLPYLPAALAKWIMAENGLLTADIIPQQRTNEQGTRTKDLYSMIESQADT